MGGDAAAGRASWGRRRYPGLVRTLGKQARDGRMLPWLVFYDRMEGRGRPELAGQLTVSGIVGGSASWGQIGYWIDQRLAGRGIIPPPWRWRRTTASA